ncbi:PadR family transcriptional regulator [Paenibacillus puldeungensis]|uniref:PadR family transcriptional regulator n=1 Tax=Paenibacillus puldeungensis TaxID=696536 RepID=A0ABW3RSW4_9BACL
MHEHNEVNSLNESSSISRDLIRGHIDTIILRVLLEGDNYGYEIMKAISSISQGQYELKEPSLYTSLKRLESQRLIESYWGEESQGGRRKYYRITPAGTDTYRTSLSAWKTARVLIDLLIEKQEG